MTSVYLMSSIRESDQYINLNASPGDVEEYPLNLFDDFFPV